MGTYWPQMTTSFHCHHFQNYFCERQDMIDIVEGLSIDIKQSFFLNHFQKLSVTDSFETLLNPASFMLTIFVSRLNPVPLAVARKVLE